ncbi:CAAX amino terminal protease self- immunity [Peptococcaceae bacterium CEB3]|nr:CAAX amino terminal protease self- immunity [Peptococcaceae bacterium CEB3]
METKPLPWRRPSWNLWQALMLIAVVGLIEFPLGWLKIPQNLTAVAGIVHFASVDIMDGVLYAGALVFLFWRLHRPLRDLGFVRPKAAQILLGLTVGVFLFLMIGLIGTVITRWAGTPMPQSFAVAVQSAKYPWEFYLLLLLGGIIAPLKEETIFRGLFYPPLRQDYGRGKGMVFTAALFAVVHLDLVRFLPLFLGGLVLVWLFETTESLWPSILAHGTWNILMALALWLQR